MGNDIYRPIGYVYVDKKTPAFIMPVFIKYMEPHKGFYVQLIDYEKDTIISFKKFNGCGGLDGEISRLDDYCVGKTPLYGIVISEEEEFFSNRLECIEYLRNTTNFDKLPPGFRLQLSSFIGDKSNIESDRTRYSEVLLSDNNRDAFDGFLLSSVSMTGWEKLRVSIGSVRTNDPIFNLDEIPLLFNFFIDANNVITLKDSINIENLQEVDIEEILKELNAEYESLLSKRSLSAKVFADGINSDVEEFDDDYNEFDLRYKTLVNDFSRQEERLAFTLACIAYAPYNAKIFVNRNDRAQTGRMGLKFIRKHFIEYKPSQQDLYLRLSEVVRIIMKLWRTGEKDLFFLYLQKWFWNHSKRKKILEPAFYIGEFCLYPYGDIQSHNLRAKEFLDSNKFRIKHALEKPLNETIKEFRTFNAHFERVIYNYIIE